MQIRGRGLVSILVVFLVSLCSAAQAQPLAAEAKSWPLAGYGNLELTLPPGWTGEAKTAQLELDLPPYVLLSPPQGHISIMVLPGGPYSAPPHLRTGITLQQLVDGEVAFLRRKFPDHQFGPAEKLPGPEPELLLSRVQMRAPDPIGFTKAVFGYVLSSGVVLKSDIRCEDFQSPLVSQTLEILHGARLDVPSTQPAEMTVPSATNDWELAMTTPGFSVERSRSAGAMRLVTATQIGLGMSLSISFRPAVNASEDATVIRDFYQAEVLKALSKYGRKMDNLTTEGDARRASDQYFYSLLHGIVDKHASVYFAHQGTWINVHLSKVRFVPQDQPLFDQILGSVRVEAVKLPTTRSSVAEPPR